MAEQTKPYLCVDESSGSKLVFEELDQAIDAKEPINPTHPAAIKAASVCLKCARFDDCVADAERWKNGEQTTQIDIISTPSVIGGLLLSMNGSRRIDVIDVADEVPELTEADQPAETEADKSDSTEVLDLKNGEKLRVEVNGEDHLLNRNEVLVLRHFMANAGQQLKRGDIISRHVLGVPEEDANREVIGTKYTTALTFLKASGIIDMEGGRKTAAYTLNVDTEIVLTEEISGRKEPVAPRKVSARKTPTEPKQEHPARQEADDDFDKSEALYVVTEEQKRQGRRCVRAMDFDWRVRRTGLYKIKTARKAKESDNADSVTQYLGSLGETPLLTKEGEAYLAKIIRKGIKEEVEKGKNKRTMDSSPDDPETAEIFWQGYWAKQKLMQSNLRLVVSIAKGYVQAGLPLLDIIQEGNKGLERAAEKFDHEKGFKFSTYATWWIRQSIQRGIYNTSRSIRLPVHGHEVLRNINKANAALFERLHREPTLGEVADYMQVDAAKLTEVLKYAKDTVHLDKPVSDDGDATLGDLIADKDAVDPSEEGVRSSMSMDVNNLLGCLDGRERIIIEMRQGLNGTKNHTLEEIGEVMNLTRERVRQLESRAYSKLRHPARGARAILGSLID